MIVARSRSLLFLPVLLAGLGHSQDQPRLQSQPALLTDGQAVDLDGDGDLDIVVRFSPGGERIL